MSMDLTSLPNPKAPATPAQALPNPKDQKKKLDQLKKDQKQVHDISNDISKTVTQVNKNLEKTFGKSAKLICLLRLDMVADKLDNINPRLATQIDIVADALENSDWES